MWLLANDIRAVFWIAVVPAAAAVLLVLFAVEEPPAAAGHPDRAAASPRRPEAARPRLLGAGRDRHPLHPRPLQRGLPDPQGVGRGPAALAGAGGAGGDEPRLFGLRLSGRNRLGPDRHPRAAARQPRRPRRRRPAARPGPGPAAAFAAIALWGLHMGLSQGLLSRLVADRSPAPLRGSAFGLFNLATGWRCSRRASPRGCCGTASARPPPSSPAPASRCAAALALLADSPDRDGH